MQNILRGFTMFIQNIDYGLDIEEVEIPIPTEVTDEVRSGGMDLGVAVSLAALEPLEVSFKMLGQAPEIQSLTALGPGKRNTFTFRGATVNEIDGKTTEHVIIVEGKISEGSREAWGRGNRTGTDYAIKNVVYYRYEVDRKIVHEIQAWPPKRVVDSVDQLADINAALGRI
jgi:uncharacterized protein